MAIEIVPEKAEEKVFNLFNFLFYFTLILFIISILSAFGFFLLNQNLKTKIEEIKVKIAEKGTPEEKALEEKILLYQKKINDFYILADSHYLNSKFFEFLESTIHPKVFFSNIDLKIKDGYIALSGTADNFETLGQQLLNLRKEKFIKEINFVKISINKEGKIEFVLNVSFDSKQFKY